MFYIILNEILIRRVVVKFPISNKINIFNGLMLLFIIISGLEEERGRYDDVVHGPFSHSKWPGNLDGQFMSAINSSAVEAVSSSG